MHHLPPPAPASAASSSSTTTSLVSRARTAIHSAAARVLTDIKADLRDIIPSPDGDSSNIEPDSTSSAKMAFPSVSVVKQLVAAIDNGKNFKSMNDMRSNGDQLLKEKGGLSLSVVKSLVRREKDERSSSEFVGDDETQSLMYSLFKLEEHFPHDKSQCNSELHHSVSLPKDLHGAPPESFTHRIAETIGKISSVYKMAYFWQSLVLELKKLWSDGQPVPRMPLDATPDLNCCLLHQEIQVINCCIARKKRRKAAKESLDSLLKRASIDNSNHLYSNGESPDSEMYVKGSAGDNVLRLGADHPSENLTLLETGEPVYSPTLQEGPIMTAELIKETEELVLRTGRAMVVMLFVFVLSVLVLGALNFYQICKPSRQAANPGCVLEDFIRWHSPPDWSEDCAASSVEVGEGSSRRGRLSERMQTKEGNLWKELWGAAKSIPAVEQAPIYDEDLAVESIFDALEVIEPSKLFEQLLAVILSVCFVAAELVLPAGSNLSKLFYDCKDYIISIYQDDMSKEKLDEICKVYETMEAIVTHPEETLQIMEAPDERSLESKYRFKIKLNFIGKDRQPLWKRAPKDPKEEKKSSPKDEKRSSEERSTKIFSNLLDKKVSIFSKKNAKPTTEVPPPPPPSSAPGPFDDSEWTIL
uniref:Rab3GAP catalytic subunit conserved domain-containing protein n=1 Tax=Oryza punctata TaxID=4537 RepID=A0A0E0LL66_ORYPU